jgi:hypothetical protein
MNITSITPSVVHFVQTDETSWNEYVRFGETNWVLGKMDEKDDTYDLVSEYYGAQLEEAFQKETTKASGKLILQRKLKYPYADGSTPEWHDHPDMFFGELPGLTEDLKEKLSAPGGEYLYRVVRKHYEVVWEGGEG